MTTATLGFVPYLRPGATLFTAVAHQYRLTGSLGKACAVERVYGKPGYHEQNLFGSVVRKTVERVFANGATAIQVLEQHTLYGVYARGLTEVRASELAARIMGGGRTPKWRRALQLDGRERFTYCHPDLRSCRDCVIDDTERFGFACWDVLHLIPAIHHCPRHGTPLHCEVLGKPNSMWDFKLPTGNVDTTDKPIGPRPSGGYSDYLRLWQDLFESRLTEIALDRWVPFIESVVSELGSVDVARLLVAKAIEDQWGMKCTHIATQLGSQVAPNFVADEFEQRASPARIAQRLILLTGLARLGIYAHDGCCGKQTTLALTSCRQSEPSIGARLRTELIKSGFPGVVIQGLRTDATFLVMAMIARVHENAIRKAITSISTPLLERIRLDPEWPAKNWVVRELQRRRSKS